MNTVKNVITLDNGKSGELDKIASFSDCSSQLLATWFDLCISDELSCLVGIRLGFPPRISNGTTESHNDYEKLQAIDAEVGKYKQHFIELACNQGSLLLCLTDLWRMKRVLDVCGRTMSKKIGVEKLVLEEIENLVVAKNGISDLLEF